LSAVDPSRLAAEEIAIDDALDRITAEPVFAKISSPHYHASAMDGICVRAEETFGATEFVGKKLGLADSDSPGADAFKYVDTGNALPAWANAVIMIEKVHQIDSQRIEIFESVAPWNHVRLVGEDVVATELLVPRAHRFAALRSWSIAGGRPYERAGEGAAESWDYSDRRRTDSARRGSEARRGDRFQFHRAGRLCP
jgi:putative molybdopterin biosynthesis protein